MTALSPSKSAFGTCGIVGHAGCGHANSHQGFVQDDSGGLSCVIRLLQKTFDIDLRIDSVSARTGLNGAYFEVTTKSGGIGKAFARRGITPDEARLAQQIIGAEAVNSQTLAVRCFGRILGQGAMEVPVALQTAIANASMDSFAKSFPDQFLYGEEEIEGNCGKILGTVIEAGGFPTSVLALSNASIGGIGPNEDIEGNVNLFGKKEIMHRLRLDQIPSIVIEGKVCAEPVSDEISENTFLVRGNEQDDNPIVAKCVKEAAEMLGYPVLYRPEMLKRSPDAMRGLTHENAVYIGSLAKKLDESSSALEKVQIAAELNRFCSEDLGGITFMSEEIHKVMGGVGCIPGSSCVLSLFIPREELQKVVQPTLSLEDVDRYVRICTESVPIINRNLEAASRLYSTVAEKF
ncbi:hypothetical protein [Parasutterella muris]|nr:hypothetical protein [Parasutterella muris]